MRKNTAKNAKKHQQKQDEKQTISKQQRQELANHIITSLADDDPRVWVRCWDAAALSPHNPITGTRYRGVNRAWLSFLTWHKGYADPRWFTFDEIAKNDTLHLTKGSKAAKVEKWNIRHVELKDKDGETLLDENGEPQTVPVLYLQSIHNIFNGSMIEGLEPMHFEPKNDEQLFEIADNLIELVKLGGKYQETADGGAYFMPMANLINMPLRGTFDTARDFVATLIHEFAHSTKAQPRMNREPRKLDNREATYAYEELVAEMTSLFVQADFGFDTFGATTETSLAYLQAWAKRTTADDDATKFVTDAISEAQKVADWIASLYMEHFGKVELAA